MNKSLFFFLSYLSLNSLTSVETRQKICIVDTGIIMSEAISPYLCNDKHWDFTGTGIKDIIGHGTNIAWIYKKYINKNTHCLKIIKYYDANNLINYDQELQSLRQSLKDECSYVNMSFAGSGSSGQEKNILLDLLNNHIILGIAAGNGHVELKYNSCEYYPACYNIKASGFHIIGSGNKQEPDWFSNYGEVITDWANGQTQCAGFNNYGGELCMFGTSQAVPNFLGNLIKKGQ